MGADIHTFKKDSSSGKLNSRGGEPMGWCGQAFPNSLLMWLGPLACSHGRTMAIDQCCAGALEAGL